MIGFSIYAYEGMGIILPVWNITAQPEHYKKVLIAVFLTVLSLYFIFGYVCYFSYGSQLAPNPIILSNMPETPKINLIVVSTIQCIYCINLVFTYPLCIYPANTIIEGHIFAGMKKSPKRKWLKNLYRTGMVTFTIVLAEILNSNLGNFLSFIGAFSCTPMGFTLPALFHYKMCAYTKWQKFVDMFIIILSSFILVFCSAYTIVTW